MIQIPNYIYPVIVSQEVRMLWMFGEHVESIENVDDESCCHMMQIFVSKLS